MILYCIILGVSVLTLVSIFGATKLVNNYRGGSTTTTRRFISVVSVVYVVLFAAFIFFCLSVWSVNARAETSGCEYVRIDGYDRPLYYDEAQDTYFVMKTENWDMLHPARRCYVDYTLGQQAFGIVEQQNNIVTRLQEY